MPYALCELLMREAEVYRTAFEKEKELTDPALKLAEVGKSKSNWEFREVLGLSVSSPKNQEYLIIKLPVPDPIFSYKLSNRWPMVKVSGLEI